MTNYERIKDMTVEEMANELKGLNWCGACCIEEKDCAKCVLSWLKSEERKVTVYVYPDAPLME